MSFEKQTYILLIKTFFQLKNMHFFSYLQDLLLKHPVYAVLRVVTIYTVKKVKNTDVIFGSLILTKWIWKLRRFMSFKSNSKHNKVTWYSGEKLREISSLIHHVFIIIKIRPFNTITPR